MNQWVAKWLRIYLKSYISLILYHRNVYPAVSFELTTYQSFNLPQFIPVSRHEGLISYIEELVTDLLSKLIHTYRVSVCILDSQDESRVLERYVLDFSEFKHTENQGVVTETEVFDEFRTSLNSLITRLEKLPSVRNGAVSFEIAIGTVQLELGHAIETGWDLRSQEQLDAFERDVNWVKCDEDEGLGELPAQLQSQQPTPRIKMMALVGCDAGPLVIHSFIEMVMFTNQGNSGTVYSQYDEDYSFQF
ncbi:Rev7p KNAG_0E01660 [Huiozyma naganishii CBS 8797]|uniref:HORMA domain-containing protein n=1 Tax=Huiozyma naganishii (strain ATCC MYA-139 / BCRC 22969 / CBS 8797 / KCTC 17520 / NBRC 10181 / NCYC 3082 / Yp74L-3) TaxID=1071383 RepID=J7RLL8_HUIN7|nr:hypothetical protein KNAG_0E01660 [Kazachstania naganishii CBS 8797]CCK70428.1 hypothetical protein KNAG_0E01660 [Kazachstania naganishii CBS 8797]